MKPDEIDWPGMGGEGVFVHDMAFLVDTWRYLALQAREENAGLKAQLLWTGDRLRERIRELEAENERLKGHGEKWPFR